MHSCPALFISGIASGQGKTTITAALARHHRNQGLHVRVFKTGPDYLDPKILAIASGNPVEQLDLWMAGSQYCAEQLYLAAKDADIILVEGAMGVLDGDPSSADLAKLFNIPVAVVVHARGMAQSIRVIAEGLLAVNDRFPLAGMICNALGSQRHIELIETSMPSQLPLLACLKRDPNISLPERHLGLVEPNKEDDLEQRLEQAALWVAETDLAKRPKAVKFPAEQTSPPKKLLQGKTIGIAKDAAFSFIYAVNERCLQEMGATLTYFSPLNDSSLPEVDALWLPGGYPELHTKTLSENLNMKHALQNFQKQQKPILAECGGMLAIQETLTDLTTKAYPMFHLIPGHGELRDRPGCQGMQTAPLPEGDVRAHAHHRSRSHDTLEPIAYGKRQRHPAPGEPIVRHKNLTASYLHLFFPSNPDAIAQLFSQQAST
ncbi:MAG: cobyrinate a,c-diamide synthase [Methylococcales bacterium]|jgi:cobyrinic acid a,c-diamide synthase|nr:cobyrinate a,c-diamide synthase [Methylococcales bacterium]MBT7442423.1 cobyrinate a,c-diamide synthase [Methylococcales bacterium]